MNSAQANSINTIEIIIKLNIPFRKSGAGYLCKSPFREDNNPSCYFVENRWKDLATGEHGRTLDLIVKIYKCSISEALKKVELIISGNGEKLMPASNPSPQTKSSRTEIRKICSLQNNALCEYVASRGIPVSLVNKYVKEVYLTTHQRRNHFYVALQNESGGYALRNKYVKRNTGSSGISVFKGEQLGISVYEGMFDFFSALRMSEKVRCLTNIVLNSTVNTKKAIDKISSIATTDWEIGLFLDADEAGRKATEMIMKEFPRAIDYSWVYAQNNLKDLNDYLLMKLKTRKTSIR